MPPKKVKRKTRNSLARGIANNGLKSASEPKMVVRRNEVLSQMRISKQKYDNTDFVGCPMGGTVFLNCSLRNAKFTNIPGHTTTTDHRLCYNMGYDEDKNNNWCYDCDEISPRTKFVRCDLRGVTFDTELRLTDFIDCKMIDVQFKKTIEQCSFDNCKMRMECLGSVRGCAFENCHITKENTFLFALKYCIFCWTTIADGIVLSESDGLAFYDCDLSNITLPVNSTCCFHRCTLENMKSTSRAKQLVNTRFNNCDMSGFRVRDFSSWFPEFTKSIFSKTIVEDRLSFMKFIQCGFYEIDFTDRTMHDVRLYQCSFTNCRMPRKIANSTFMECYFKNCPVVSIAWSNVVFEKTRLSQCNWTRGSIKKLSFVDCVFLDSCIEGMLVDHSIFNRTRFVSFDMKESFFNAVVFVHCTPYICYNNFTTANHVEIHEDCLSDREIRKIVKNMDAFKIDKSTFSVNGLIESCSDTSEPITSENETSEASGSESEDDPDEYIDQNEFIAYW